MDLLCPSCRNREFTVINPAHKSTERFRPYLHSDPSLRLICDRCGWVGLLQWLANFNHKVSHIQ